MTKKKIPRPNPNLSNTDYLTLKRVLLFNRATILHMKTKKVWPLLTSTQNYLLLTLTLYENVTVSGMRTKLKFFHRDMQKTYIKNNFLLLIEHQLVVCTIKGFKKTYAISIAGRNYLFSLENHLKTTRLDK